MDDQAPTEYYKEYRKGKSIKHDKIFKIIINSLLFIYLPFPSALSTIFSFITRVFANKKVWLSPCFVNQHKLDSGVVLEQRHLVDSRGRHTGKEHSDKRLCAELGERKGSVM